MTKLPDSAATFAAVVLALVLLAPPVLSADQIVGIASVIDGDTMEIHGTRIRLFANDAPLLKL